MHLNLISYCSEETLPHPHPPPDFPVHQCQLHPSTQIHVQIFDSSFSNISLRSFRKFYCLYYLLIRRVFIQYTLIIQNSEFYVAFAYTSKNMLLYLSLSPNDSHFLSHPLLSFSPISCNTSPSTCLSFLELDAFIKFYLFRE